MVSYYPGPVFMVAVKIALVPGVLAVQLIPRIVIAWRLRNPIKAEG